MSSIMARNRSDEDAKSGIAGCAGRAGWGGVIGGTGMREGGVAPLRRDAVALALATRSAMFGALGLGAGVAPFVAGAGLGAGATGFAAGAGRGGAPTDFIAAAAMSLGFGPATGRGLVGLGMEAGAGRLAPLAVPPPPR